MTDDELLEALEAGTLDASAFHHAEHVRVAWAAIGRDGDERGGHAVAEGIRRLAVANGAPGVYHETITRFWLRVVGHARRARPDLSDGGAALAALPVLADASAPFRHWRRETLLSDAAREGWVAPDLAPLPE